jgi:hypothetical protein
MLNHSAINNAQDSRGIIVAVQVGAVKIYVAAAVEPFMKNERQGETQEPSTPVGC